MNTRTVTSSQAEKYVRNIIKEKFGTNITTLRRFPTGLSHFVYDVVTEDNFPCVVRLARPERRAELEQGIYWQTRLEDAGVPLPKIYHTGEVNHHPYVVCERLPGSDLEAVYASLSAQEKKSIAHAVAEIQQKVYLIGPHHFETVYPWVDVLHTIVNRTERELLAKAADQRQRQYIGRIRQKIEAHGDYLSAVQPVAFLYDLNVRNVIVKEGKVTGIIDVDAVWWGDPLLAIGRGKTILLTMQQDTDFITHWCQFLNLSDLQLKMVDFYALLYSLRFMGTMGQTLNGNYSLQTDPHIASLLVEIADDLLDALEE